MFPASLAHRAAQPSERRDRIPHRARRRPPATSPIPSTPGQPNGNILSLIEGATSSSTTAPTEREFAEHVGWGTPPERGMRLCRMAGVKQLAIFHHDPTMKTTRWTARGRSRLLGPAPW
jgi:hypothetical protein